MGVSPLVAGLTVVAFGASAPELAVSVQSAWTGRTEVAVGNVVGSNTFNVLLILGLSATITPLAVSLPLVRRDVPLMIGASAVVYALAADGSLGAVDGLMLVAGVIAYTAWPVAPAKRDPTDDEGLPSNAAGGPSAGAAAVQNFNALIAKRTNEIVQTLTVVTAVMLPLSLIAGVYGMNVKT